MVANEIKSLEAGLRPAELSSFRSLPFSHRP